MWGVAWSLGNSAEYTKTALVLEERVAAEGVCWAARLETLHRSRWCSREGTGARTGWVMKATLRIDPNCCRAVVLEQSWGKLSPSLSFPQPPVPAADLCGGLYEELASFRWEQHVCILESSWLQEPSVVKGRMVGSVRKWELGHQHQQVAGSLWTSWVVGGMEHGLWDQTDLPLLGWVTLGK